MRALGIVVVRAELPDQSGFTLCGQIKKGKWGQNLRVLLLSSDTGVEGLNQHRQTPGAADGYLIIPFEMGELASMSVGIMPPEEEQAPAFSGDGQWIAYFARNQLLKVPVSGGTPIVVAPPDSVSSERISTRSRVEL